MSDPRRIKNIARITADIKYEDMDKPMQLHSLINGDVLKKIPKQDIVEKIKSEIGKISLKPGTELYRTYVSYSYADDSATEDFDFGNVLIEVNLPYCLHLPNFNEIVVNVAEENIEALVTFQKIWTNRARTAEGDSENIDLYADEREIYFKKSTILGPTMPFKPDEGWESFITGINIEKVNDSHGVFRYSRLYIQLNADLPKNIKSLKEKECDRLLSAIHDKSLIVVNRIIDNYRMVTNEIHVRRLGTLKINLIYFLEQQNGYYVANYNVKTAMINRSKNDLKQLSSLLSSGKKPDLYKLLLFNAKNSFNSKDFTLAIVESFQALEIFVENFLIFEFKKRGDNEKQIKIVLNKSWQTKERLNFLMKNLKGKSLNEKMDIWDPWCNRYDITRNEVIHAGKEPTEKETSETLEINEKVIDWILSL
jgi:HEPN domain-containing protein